MRYKYIDNVERARELGLAGPRDRTAHLHTLDGKPLIGASSGSNVSFGADNLMQWYADNAAVAGLSKPQQDITEEYKMANALNDKNERAKAKKELDKNYPDYEDARKAAIRSRDDSAKKGTLRHGVLETYINLCVTSNDGKPVKSQNADIQPFIDWSLENVDQFYFTEANCYNEELWVGGIADIGLRLKNGKNLIGDHKSSREAYAKQFLQAALYDVLLSHSGMLDAKGNKLGEWVPADGIVIFPFRSVPFTPEFKWNIDEWRQGAVNAVNLYKLLKI